MWYCASIQSWLVEPFRFIALSAVSPSCFSLHISWWNPQCHSSHVCFTKALHRWRVNWGWKTDFCFLNVLKYKREHPRLLLGTTPALHCLTCWQSGTAAPFIQLIYMHVKNSPTSSLKLIYSSISNDSSSYDWRKQTLRAFPHKPVKLVKYIQQTMES